MCSLYLLLLAYECIYISYVAYFYHMIAVQKHIVYMTLYRSRLSSRLAGHRRRVEAHRGGLCAHALKQMQRGAPARGIGQGQQGRIRAHDVLAL